MFDNHTTAKCQARNENELGCHALMINYLIIKVEIHAIDPWLNTGVDVSP